MPADTKELHYLAFGMQILKLVEISLHVESVGRNDVRPVKGKKSTNLKVHTIENFF